MESYRELRHESLNEHFLKKAPTSAKCIGSVLYATKNGGRLGNIMFELLGLYAIAEKTGRAPVVYENYMNDKIKELSGNHPHVASLFYDADTSECGTPTFIDLHYKGCCKFDQEIIDGILAHESHQAVTLKLFYLQSFKFFNNLPRAAIHRFFTPGRKLLNAVGELFELRPKRTNLNICVHIRRGDFTNSTETLASEAMFSKSAVDYVLAKVQEEDSRSPQIYVMSDDDLWAKETFRNRDMTNFVRQGVNVPLGSEWEFSRQFCDRVLLTASISTYGYWIGFLSRGQKVYYNENYTYNNGMQGQLVTADFWPTHWTPLRYDDMEKRVVEPPPFQEMGL
ncbi:hypothetical protein Q1695_000933 [Nippostrongylus brasiliensis]|nr:hypothetical protein Q1695_000933 [Nippostrongylus brasiliensis]